MNSEGKWRVSLTSKLKTDWTWEEWRQSRTARRAVAERIGPAVVRRRESSSDRRLHEAFQEQRGPAFVREEGHAKQPN